MSQTVITLAFEQWKAQQAVTQDAIVLDEFVFAHVPDLDPEVAIDRNESLPPAAQIVYRQAVSRKGVVNDNAVVHSAVLGAEVGDFSFNWIGLINKASGTLAMIVHAPIQQKLKTAAGQQGNVLTRSFLMAFDGAQVETGINTPAETWQIDFTARMAGMDERQRRENVDIYGAAAFFGDGWLVGNTGKQFFITKGAGYVAGLRAELVADKNITVTNKPITVWLDVCWTGTLISVWGVETDIRLADDLADYEKDGVQHFVFALASIDADGAITDLRPGGTLDGQAASDALKRHEQSRNHPDATTSAKGFVQLSSATNSASEKYAATPKAVKTVQDNANRRLEKAKNLADLTDIVAARLQLDVHSKSEADDRYYSQSGGKVDGSMISLGSHMILKGEDRKHFGIQNDNGQSRMWIYKDKGGDGVRLNNGDEGAGEWLFHTNGHFYSPAAIHAAEAILQEDGNVHGSVWGGHISGWIIDRANEAASSRGAKNTARISNDGWWLCGDTGIIMQWGYVKGTNATFNFPLTFPHACFNVVASNADAQGDSVDNAFGYPINNSSFFVATKVNGANKLSGYPIFWTAIGH